MRAIIDGGHLVCGVDSTGHWLTCQITNLPPDTIKIRRSFRHGHVGSVFVWTSAGVTKWHLEHDGDNLKLIYPAVAANSRQRIK